MRNILSLFNRRHFLGAIYFSVLSLSLFLATPVAHAQESERRDKPHAILSQWRMGIAIQSPLDESMNVYLWFYEWNMFGARTKGQHTHGSHHWKRNIDPDGRTATIDARDMLLTVVAVPDGAQLKLEITNRTDHRWPEIAGIIPCFNPGKPKEEHGPFPNAPLNAEFDNEKTWYVGATGLKRLTARDIHFNAMLREKVDAESKDGQFVFTKKWPTSPDNAHAGLIVREATNGQWVTGIAWQQFLSSQGHNPWSCMHLSVRVGPLEPGESKTIRGRIYLFPGNRESCLARFRRDFSQLTRP